MWSGPGCGAITTTRCCPASTTTLSPRPSAELADGPSAESKQDSQTIRTNLFIRSPRSVGRDGGSEDGHRHDPRDDPARATHPRSARDARVAAPQLDSSARVDVPRLPGSEPFAVRTLPGRRPCGGRDGEGPRTDSRGTEVRPGRGPP